MKILYHKLFTMYIYFKILSKIFLIKIAQNDGYVLSSLIVDGEPVPATESLPFENVTSNHEISATFEALTENKLKILDNYTILQTVKMGMDEITLSNTSDTFNEWDGKGIEIESSKQQSITIDMPNNDTEIIVNHKPTLKLTLDEDTVIETEKTAGETVDLTATIATGEVFGGWLAKGVELEPMTLTQSFTMPDNNVEIILSKRASGQGPLLKLILSDGTEIETEKTIGETVTLTSEITGDVTFTSWDVYGVEIDNEIGETITFTMPSNDVYIKINQE